MKKRSNSVVMALMMMLFTVVFAQATARDPISNKIKFEQQTYQVTVAEVAMDDQITITMAQGVKNAYKNIGTIAQTTYTNLFIPALEVTEVRLFRADIETNVINKTTFRPPHKKDCKHKVPAKKKELKKKSKPKYAARQWRQQMKQNN